MHKRETDYGGWDVFGQLVIGARNSLTIGIVITLVHIVIGITLGVIAVICGGGRLYHHALYRFHFSITNNDVNHRFRFISSAF